MVLNIVAKDGVRNGNYSLHRVIAFFGFVALTVALIIEAYQGKLVWQMFIAYPVGAVGLYSPKLLIILLKIWKGIPENGK